MIRKGITIVEIIIVTSLVALISIVVLEVFTTHNRLYRNSFSQSQVQNNNLIAMSQITQVINQSSRVLVSQVINGNNYLTDNKTLALELPAFDAAGNQLVGFDYAAVYSDPLDPKKLMLIVQAAANSRRPTATKLLTNLLETVNFKYNSPEIVSANAVTVYLKIQEIVSGITNEATATSTVYLQNK